MGCLSILILAHAYHSDLSNRKVVLHTPIAPAVCISYRDASVSVVVALFLTYPMNNYPNSVVTSPFALMQTQTPQEKASRFIAMAPDIGTKLRKLCHAHLLNFTMYDGDYPLPLP